MVTIVDVTEAHFGEQIGPDLIRRVACASFEELRAWQQVVRAFTSDVPLAPRPPDQIRPYVPTERQSTRVAPHGFHLRPTDFRDPEKVERGFQSLKHHLLYCHSLAFDDPLPWLLDPFVIDPPAGTYFEETREAVLNCLAFLSWIRPLIASGTVVLVEPGLNPSYAERVIRDTDGLIESTDFSDLPEELSVLLRRNGDLAKQTFLHSANEHLAQSLAALARNSEALDLYLPYRHHEDLLRVVVDQSRSAQGSSRVGELRVMRHLLQVGVPMLGTLEISDIVAIREGEEAFERWRRGLELGLHRVNSLDPCMLGVEEESLRVIRQELSEEGRALAADLKRSRFFGQAARSKKDFVISGIGLAFNPAALPATAAQRGSSLLWDLLAGRRRTNANASTLRHYLLFAPSPD